ncbi:ribose import ATP-binding protein RbsA [Spirochaetia bacterium]|nr:ribose import ATP-binding protein RbsA [Spirochaetia bacterium]
MGNEIVLETKNIVKRFPGTLALNNINIKVYAGEAHALVGENGAGKSTLMNIIGGVFPADSGAITFLGKEVNFKTTEDAQSAGIGFVHQELNLCDHIKASENIFMGRMPKTRWNMVDKKTLYIESKKLLHRLNSDIDPNRLVSDLTIAQCQIIEIVKALSLNIKLLILDEPTSSLTLQETKLLFEIIKEIKKEGIAVLYISHRMEEIFEICDTVTVLRDGEQVQQLKIEDATVEEIIQLMVGREIKNLYPPKSGIAGNSFFRAANFSNGRLFHNVSFEVKQGEILGFYGLIGAGRSEVMRAVCAIDPCQQGERFLNDKPFHPQKYKELIDRGIAYITEDRKAQGLFLHRSIIQNISASDLRQVARGIIIRGGEEKKLAEKFSSLLAVKCSSLQDHVNSLSGGNQQKVMIGKWLAIEPKLLILDEPTRGIDVGAKSEIHKLLRRLCDEGVCVVLISSELPEVIGMCDRVIVMHEGVITGELSGDAINEKNIIIAASKADTAKAS